MGNRLNRTYSGMESTKFKPKGLWFSFGHWWIEDGVGCEEYTEDFYEKNDKRTKIYQITLDVNSDKILKVKNKQDLEKGIKNGLWTFSKGKGYKLDSWNKD